MLKMLLSTHTHSIYKGQGINHASEVVCGRGRIMCGLVMLTSPPPPPLDLGSTG